MKPLEPREIGVAEFKARCTTLMPEVARTGRPLRVVRRGKPLVDVTPAARVETPFIGRLAGAITVEGDVTSPIGEAWSADADQV